MCGIAGIWSKDHNDIKELLSQLSYMTESLHHRGPDDEGYWSDEISNLVLGHRRLSILDLSSLGKQPMKSISGRYVVVYNGEIYNHKKIRLDLEKEKKSITWRGTSDTETLLAAIDNWGIEKTLTKSNGMFALAIWDSVRKTLSLARDRMGEKPLYYKLDKTGLSFASEVKALAINQRDLLRLDTDSISDFLRFSYIPSESSIYESIRKITPGTLVNFSSPFTSPKINKFWSLEQVIKLNSSQRNSISKETLDDQSTKLEKLLSEVISNQMISDVPLGSFLSGGVDSSLVTSLMQANSSIPVKTFSIGFRESAYNESQEAKEVAKILGTDHQEFLVDEEEALEAIKDLPKIYDEPFSDSSQIPTLLLCRHARKEVTVALTGDGGDEIFGGYNRYLFAPSAWRMVSKLPRVFRRRISMLANLMHFIAGSESKILNSFIGSIGLPGSTLDRIKKLGMTLAQSNNSKDIYYGLISTQNNPESLLNFQSKSENLLKKSDLFHSLNFLEWMMAMDSISYLPDDILVKVDRASMSTSLETRAPYLDHRIVEFAWKLSSKHKINKSTGKVILRKILEKHIPKELIERPKQGFAIPIDRWLRGELKSWAEDILTTEKLTESGIFNTEEVQNLWTVHLSGSNNLGHELWAILMFQCWFEINHTSKLLTGERA